jgi:hypothetical protein
MPTRSDKRRGTTNDARKVEKRIREWEKQCPDTWILLEVTEEKDGEPLRGKLIATARDLEDLQKTWKLNRNKGIQTMLTYGPPLEPGPAVVVSAT